MRQMARIFLSRIIGRRFAGGPRFFPGFGRGVSIPDLIYAGYLPVLAMVFSSFAIPLCISGGTYFTYSALSPSSPTLFWFFMRLDTFSISSVVKGGRFYDCWCICCYRCKHVLKMFGYYVGLFFIRTVIRHIFPMYNEGFLWLVAV